MNTSFILIINPLVASGTGRGDAGLRDSRTAHVVGAVAIDAKRRLQISFRKQGIVNAVEGFRVVVEVTTFARFLISQSELAEIFERPRRMRVSRDIRVAVGTAQLAAMNRARKSLRIDKERALFAARQHKLQILIAMATEAELHVG